MKFAAAIFFLVLPAIYLICLTSTEHHVNIVIIMSRSFLQTLVTLHLQTSNTSAILLPSSLAL